MLEEDSSNPPRIRITMTPYTAESDYCCYGRSHLCRAPEAPWLRPRVPLVRPNPMGSSPPCHSFSYLGYCREGPEQRRSDPFEIPPPAESPSCISRQVVFVRVKGTIHTVFHLILGVLWHILTVNGQYDAQQHTQREERRDNHQHAIT